MSKFTRHIYCLSLTLIFFFIVRMRDALPHIHSERDCHTSSFLLLHALFLTRVSYNSTPVGFHIYRVI